MDDPERRIEWFQTAIVPFIGDLRARLRRILRAEHDLDDIVSETLARAYAVADCHEVRSGLALITRIAYNILVDIERRRSVVSFDFLADLGSLEQSIRYEAMFEARDELRRVERIIATLPGQARRAFVMRRIEGASIKDISAAMCLSPSTVEKHLQRALMQIARAISQDEEHALGYALQESGGARTYRGGGGTTRHRP